MTPTAFCFHEAIRGFGIPTEMIELWRRSWERCGWKTRVLGMADARAHPGFAEFRNHVGQFYSRNSGCYDHLCWTRWLAFAQAGGGLMTDYDVIARKLAPADIISGTPAIHHIYRVPCCVSADAAGADLIVESILAATSPKRQHFSDMLFFQASAFPHTTDCRELGEPGWEDAGGVHFSRNAARLWNAASGKYRSREQLIRDLMPV